MVDQENNNIGVADSSVRVLEDCSFDGSDRIPVLANGVGKLQERAECENLGISSCTVEQEMRNGIEPIATESNCIAKVDGEVGENLGVSGCNSEEGMRSVSLVSEFESSEQKMRNSVEPIAVESTSVVKIDGEVRENLGVSGCNIEEGMGNIRLVSGLESSVMIGENEGKGEIKMGKDESESSESESDNPSSPTSSSSSSSVDNDYSSASDGSSEDDDSEDNEEEEQREKEKLTEKIEVEVEEGEIKDSDGQELVTDFAVSDDDDDEDIAEAVTWSGINDEEDDTATEGPIRSKNEVKDLPSVPPVNVALEPHHQMLPVGVVMSIISSQIIVEGMEKHNPLNEGSILWMTESRTPLGLVDEIFGPVKNPFYIVRYNSENDIPTGVHVGTAISFVPEFANHVLNNKDLYEKGYDASGLNDEEVFDEAEFSDDEKEAEYRKMQKMMKRGISDKNHGKQKHNKKKAPRKNGPAVSPYPKTPASPFSGVRQGPFEAARIVPPFPPTNAGPSLASNGVWTNGAGPNLASNGVCTNGISLVQLQSALLPNGYPPNGISWFPGNTQNPYQLPMTGLPFQQQIVPSLGSLPGTSLPGVQPNIFSQPLYPQGFAGQNQMTCGSSFPQIQVSASGGEQGFLPYEMQSERNHNLQSGFIPDNLRAPNQFRPGGSANRGRKTFHQRGRKSWRPTK